MGRRRKWMVRCCVYRGDPGFSLWIGGEEGGGEFEDIARPRFFAISKMAERMNGAPSWSHCTAPSLQCPLFYPLFLPFFLPSPINFSQLLSTRPRLESISRGSAMIVAWKWTFLVDRARINRNSVQIGRRIDLSMKP